MVGAGLLGRERLRRLEDRGAVFEVALLRMAQAGALPTLADLLAEVRAGGGVAAPAAVAPTRAAPRFGAAAAAPGGASGGGGGPLVRLRRRGRRRPGRRPAPATSRRARSALLQRPCAAAGDVRAVQGRWPDGRGRVVVTLHTDRKMHQDRLQSPVVQQELAKAVQDAAGRPVKVEFRVANAGSGEAEGAAGGGAPPQRHEIGPTAKRVVERFRGRVVQVNPEDRIGEVPPPAAEDEAPPAPGPGDGEG
jgi:hypothetical protein